MLDLIFASNNLHKLEEVRSLLAGFNILSAREAGALEELPETGSTLHENAEMKAKKVYELTGRPGFSDDTGLFVDCLNGAPGVYSARYAGDKASSLDNIEKLLKAMENCSNRSARFKTVVCLYEGQQPLFFEGEVSGRITEKPFGKSGFGYDPVFIPDGLEKTFSEIPSAEKNMLSHRKKALEKMEKYLLNG